MVARISEVQECVFSLCSCEKWLRQRTDRFWVIKSFEMCVLATSPPAARAAAAAYNDILVASPTDDSDSSNSVSYSANYEATASSAAYNNTVTAHLQTTTPLFIVRFCRRWPSAAAITLEAVDHYTTFNTSLALAGDLQWRRKCSPRLLS